MSNTDNSQLFNKKDSSKETLIKHLENIITNIKNDSLDGISFEHNLLSTTVIIPNISRTNGLLSLINTVGESSPILDIIRNNQLVLPHIIETLSEKRELRLATMLRKQSALIKTEVIKNNGIHQIELSLFSRDRSPSFRLELSETVSKLYNFPIVFLIP